MRSYPSIPLWMLAADGGLGLQSLMDFTQKCKLKMLLKNIARNDNTGLAFQGLVARALRSAGAGCPGKRQRIESNLSDTTWITSLSEWLEKMGLFIEVQGLDDTSPPSTQVTGDRARRVHLFDRGVSLEEEISDLPALTPIPIRIGQCWLLGGLVHEIVSIGPDYVESLEWTPADPLLSPGSHLTIDTKNDYCLYSKGQGSDNKVLFKDLMKSCTLVERSPDCIKSSLDKRAAFIDIVWRELLSSTVSMTRSRRPSLPCASVLKPLPQSGLIDNLYFHSIYTDGSWSKRHSLSTLLLNEGSVETAGAIVLHTNHGLFTIRVEMDIDVRSAFDAEVVSLLIAHEMARRRRVKIWSDCSSAIKSLNGGGLGGYSQVLSGWVKSKRVSFLKVKAHPEHRGPVSDWTLEE